MDSPTHIFTSVAMATMNDLRCYYKKKLVIMSSVPSPPPPPPIISTLSLQQLPSNKSAAAPLKPLFWKRLQFAGSELSPKDVVWKHVEVQALTDPGAFRRLFQLRAVTPTDSRPRHLARESNTVRLLDCRKSQAIEIFLKGMHVESEELQDALLKLDTSVVDPSTVAALCEMMPTAEELELIHTYLEKHPNCSLDGPEMFLYQLSLIDCFHERAHCFIFQVQFREYLASLHQHLLTLQQASQSLFRNPQLNKVLGVVLAAGNLMNAGNLARGEADGFQIDILSRLKDVRSMDGSGVNLLQYVVNYYCTQIDSEANMSSSNATFPLPCPSLNAAAAGISFGDLKQDLGTLQHQLSECEARFKACDTSKGNGQLFKQKMESFFTNAKSELESCQRQIHTVKELFNNVVDFYCMQPALSTGEGKEEEEDGKVSPKQFFSLWTPFLQQFKQCWEKEQQSLARKRLENLQATRLSAAQLKPLSNTGLKAKLKIKLQKK